MSDTLTRAQHNVEDERAELIGSAMLLTARLKRLIQDPQREGLFELPTISVMLGRMRDSIESYRTACAVQAALTAATGGGEEAGR